MKIDLSHLRKRTSKPKTETSPATQSAMAVRKIAIPVPQAATRTKEAADHSGVAKTSETKSTGQVAQSIGLDSLLTMSPDDLYNLSPKGTFTSLRKPVVKKPTGSIPLVAETASQATATCSNTLSNETAAEQHGSGARVGLNDLFRMETGEIKKLGLKPLLND